ncbi:MAG: NrfD/PsrC family molybdoenzyme membrane anchor subunit [Flavobacteriaceae bacterium]|nr:NrfD/PsrC family molybdoenzyme membrane anchor subunit [Flavobacteriaceae bacterium]
MTTREEIIKKLAPKEFNKLGVIWVSLLCIVSLAGIIAYIDQIIRGLEVTNLRDYAIWGVYISNFVFFVATSFVGAFTASILRLSQKKWRTPLVRIAEMVAVSAIAMAGVAIILDMGRPDRIHYLFIYPRLQSPIAWDIIIITIYLAFSIMLLYIPNIPDFAILKKHHQDKPFLSKVYGFLAINWSGSANQIKIHQKTIKVIAVTMIPLALILQSVDAWLFSTTYRIGWDSTNLGPYFIAGAFVAGTGALITAVYMVRKFNNLEEFITEKHFDKLGRLLVFACLVYLYFNMNEYLVPAFKSTQGEVEHLMALFFGDYSLMFWFSVGGGLILPSILLMFRKMRKPFPMFIIAILVVVTSWWKRYIIVSPALLHPFMPIQGVPEEWNHYFPSLHEWLITGGTLALSMLIITIFVRFIPVVPIQRTIDEMGITETENDKN